MVGTEEATDVFDDLLTSGFYSRNAWSFDEVEENPSEKEPPEDESNVSKRNIGRLKGKVHMACGFNETPAEFMDYM